MKIHNFRAGFATNSSSSHSVILLPDNLIGKVSDKEAERDSNEGYHWDDFRLASQEQKLRYLAAQMFTAYVDDDDKNHTFKNVRTIVNLIDKEIAGYKKEYEKVIRKDKIEWNDVPMVDHQSTIPMPKNLDKDYLKDLIAYFKSPKVVVLGGNDNGGSTNYLVNYSTKSFFDKIKETQMKIKKENNFWVLFDTYSGNKIRVDFEDENASVNYQKSITPELVDLKITDFCEKNCSFCYQSSTPKGKHAKFEDIEQIVKMLSQMNVFEIAIGGGEPTEHPQFLEILKMIRAYDMVPNFTTYSDKWLYTMGDEVSKYVGSVGVSCLSEKDLDLVKEIQKFGIAATAQHVLGSVPLGVTSEFINKAFSKNCHVLLLGFKEVGFGKEYKRFDTKDETTEFFIKMAHDYENKWSKLSVDTALVDTYPNMTKILGVPEALVSSPEGKFSCYIDAVEGLMGPSSYIDVKNMTPLVLDVEKFKEVYATY